MKVQHWFADGGASDRPADSYISVSCLACTRMHFVNPSTGKVHGENSN